LRIDTAVHLQTAGQSLSLHRETIQEKEMSRKAKLNYTIDVIIGLAFILSALSGLVLFFVPGGYQGGRNPYYLQPALLTTGTFCAIVVPRKYPLNILGDRQHLAGSSAVKMTTVPSFLR
jgi:hypothetical protein